MQDSQLLEEFVARNSQTAFQSLVTRYLGLVRATALRQVRDAALADEISQAVFILLARKAASLGKDNNLLLGGWLYRTTRFVASRAQRGEARRRQREHEAFNMQQLSATDDSWRRIAPLLDEGIEQLDRVSRDAVILRFLQDEPLQAVGGALGITEEAARKRVHRSLEKLRAFFSRHGFSISAAALATALAGHHAEAASVELAHEITAHSVAHSAAASQLPVLVAETLRAWQWARLKLFAGFASVALVAATTTIVLTANTGRSQNRPPSTSPVAIVAGNPTAAASQNAAPSPAQATARWQLSLQVVDAQTGQPIPKAKVQTMSVGDMKQIVASPQQIDHQSDLQTDDQGRCVVTLPYDPLMVGIGIVANGYEVRSLVGGVPKPLPDSYVLRMPRGARIGGVVQNENGQPVAGAAVEISFYGTGDSSEREFQRERPGVIDDNGITAVTDKTGHWSFASAPTNGDFRLNVAHSNFPSANFPNDDDPRMTRDANTIKLASLHDGSAVLVLKSGLTLQGSVTDQNGYRIAGARVGNVRFFAVNSGVATESDGSFHLTALSPGEETITVTAAGFAPQRIPVQMSTTTPPLAVQLKPGGRLHFHVVDTSGAPISEAYVALEQWEGPNTLQWDGLTSADGRLDWNSAPTDAATFSILKDGYFTRRQATFTADDQEHTITLQPQVTVAGRVIDADTKQPIAAFKVIPGSDISMTAKGSNGLYQIVFTELSPTAPTLSLRIEADGYEPATSSPLDPTDTNATCNFALKKLSAQSAIQGVVLLPDGSAGAGVDVALAAEKPVEMARTRLLAAGKSLIIHTDANGHFTFPGSQTARAIVAVHPQGFACVPVTADNHTLTIQLQPWGRIEGTLRLVTESNSDQSVTLVAGPQPGQEDTVYFSLGGYTAKTDAQGNFVFDQAPPGKWNIFMSKINFPYSHKTPVEVPPGATASVQVGSTGAILSGRLTLAKPLPNVDWSKQLLIANLRTRLPYPAGLSGKAMSEWYQKFRATPEGREAVRNMDTFPLVVQPDGAFAVEDVPPGTFVLNCQLSNTNIDLSHGVLGYIVADMQRDITITAPEDGNPLQKIDLGTLNLTNR